MNNFSMLRQCKLLRSSGFLAMKIVRKSFKAFSVKNGKLAQHPCFFCSTNKPFFPNTHDELLICNQNLIDRKLCKPHYFHHKFGKVWEDINIVIKWDRLSGKGSASLHFHGFYDFCRIHVSQHSSFIGPLKRSRSLNDCISMCLRNLYQK